jgi:hypothetical protein
MKRNFNLYVKIWSGERKYGERGDEPGGAKQDLRLTGELMRR